MAIEHLINLVPAPESPVGVGSITLWNELESQSGLRFPKDYMDYIDRYGSGGWCDELTIHSPFFALSTLLKEHESQREHYLRMHASSPFENPVSFFPERDGLLYLGGDCDGNRLFWHCSGPADEWPLILCVRGYYALEQFSMPLTEWLVRWLTGGLRSNLLRPISACDSGPGFSPSRSPRAVAK